MSASVRIEGRGVRPLRARLVRRLHQMMPGLQAADQESVWKEIEGELRAFEGSEGFTGPCEMLVGVGRR